MMNVIILTLGFFVSYLIIKSLYFILIRYYNQKVHLDYWCELWTNPNRIMDEDEIVTFRVSYRVGVPLIKWFLVKLDKEFDIDYVDVLNDTVLCYYIKLPLNDTTRIDAIDKEIKPMIIEYKEKYKNRSAKKYL